MPAKRIQVAIVIGILCFAALRTFGEPAGAVIFDMDTVVHQPNEVAPGKEKIKAGVAELVEGKFGKAVKFSFVDKAQGGFMTARVRPDKQWQDAAGFSFWVKGDGSHSWGGIEWIDRDDYGFRYAYCFPIDSTDWRKITVPWRDVIAEMASPLIGGKDGYSPQKFGTMSFGKWFYWRDYPAESYAIDQVQLEPVIAEDAAPAVEPGLRRLRAKLDHHQPITIVTMGDSLTDEHHWSNRQVVWHKLLADAIKAKCGSEVKIVNPAIGGTTLSQNLVLTPRWGAEAPAPDLVTIWFGGNDWASGVRGPRFAEYLRLAVDRIRRQTHGSADILLMTSAPSHKEFETMKELEQAARDVAAEQHTGLADVAAEFRKLGSADEGVTKEYWAWDHVHLGAKGHAVASEAVLRAIDAEKGSR